MRRLTRLFPWLTTLFLIGILAGGYVMAQSGGDWSITEQSDTRIVLERGEVSEPTATAEPTAEPTATHDHGDDPPVTLGWHGPEAHDGLNVHEHGDAPPQWVLDSDHPPFTQTRESHTGYKGVYDVSDGGIESYLIAHVIATTKARSHGDHDYQLWLRGLDGSVFFVEGQLCFTEDERCTETPVHSVVDDSSIRPVIQSVNDGACETWYSDPGAAVIDVGFTICGRYQHFDGTVTGDVGTFRTVDFVIPCSRLPDIAALQDGCQVEFGLSRLSFIVNSKEYDAANVVEPIN